MQSSVTRLKFVETQVLYSDAAPQEKQFSGFLPTTIGRHCGYGQHKNNFLASSKR